VKKLKKKGGMASSFTKTNVGVAKATLTKKDMLSHMIQHFCELPRVKTIPLSDQDVTSRVYRIRRLIQQADDALHHGQDIFATLMLVVICIMEIRVVYGDAWHVQNDMHLHWTWFCTPSQYTKPIPHYLVTLWNGVFQPLQVDRYQIMDQLVRLVNTTPGAESETTRMAMLLMIGSIWYTSAADSPYTQVANTQTVMPSSQPKPIASPPMGFGKRVQRLEPSLKPSLLSQEQPPWQDDCTADHVVIDMSGCEVSPGVILTV
jgi:hypothetical protein